MKILISAYACEPGQGSESGVGWNVVKELSKYHQIWVLTSNTHRQGIESELASNGLSNIHFVYFDPFGYVLDWNLKVKPKQWQIQPHYYLWQVWAYFVGYALHKKIDFEVVHHITYVKYSSPSFLSLLPISFIWGPVGGGESTPKAFWKDFTSSQKKYEIARELARKIGEYDPFVQLTARRSVLIRATTKDTAQRLAHIGANQIQVFPEAGLSKDEIEKLGQGKIYTNSPIKFISIGRLLHWKGFDLGLRAFAQAKIPNEAEYWLIGDGPERERLEDIVKDSGISSRVKFWGRLPREETLDKLKQSHILVHPSLHDSGGWVCLEGMAAGCPVICLDLGGPAVQVTQETGFKIPADTPEQVVKDITQKMEILGNDFEWILRMGQAGQKRVREVFCWESKGRKLAKLYDNIQSQKK